MLKLWAIGMGLIAGMGATAIAILATSPPEFSQSVEVVERSFNVGQIQAMGFLQTAEVDLALQIPATDVRRGLGLEVNAAKAHYEAIVVVSAGVDFSKAKLNDDGEIEIPKAEVHRIAVDVGRSKLLDCDPAWWNPSRQICADLLEAAQREAVLRATNADHAELLLRARNEAVQEIKTRTLRPVTVVEQ